MVGVPYSGPGFAQASTSEELSAGGLPSGLNSDNPSTAARDAAAGAEGDSSPWFMTQDEVECLGSLSITDKLSALSLITKIGQEDADRIYDMASDGITREEMNEIKAILGKSLSQEDLDMVYSLIEKNRDLYAGRID
jgi:hypothetical protein